METSKRKSCSTEENKQGKSKVTVCESNSDNRGICYICQHVLEDPKLDEARCDDSDNCTACKDNYYITCNTTNCSGKIHTLCYLESEIFHEGRAICVCRGTPSNFNIFVSLLKGVKYDKVAIDLCDRSQLYFTSLIIDYAKMLSTKHAAPSPSHFKIKTSIWEKMPLTTLNDIWQNSVLKFESLDKENEQKFMRRFYLELLMKCDEDIRILLLQFITNECLKRHLILKLSMVDKFTSKAKHLVHFVSDIDLIISSIHFHFDYNVFDFAVPDGYFGEIFPLFSMHTQLCLAVIRCKKKSMTHSQMFHFLNDLGVRLEDKFNEWVKEDAISGILIIEYIETIWNIGKHTALSPVFLYCMKGAVEMRSQHYGKFFLVKIHDSRQQFWNFTDDEEYQSYLKILLRL